MKSITILILWVLVISLYSQPLSAATWPNNPGGGFTGNGEGNPNFMGPMPAARENRPSPAIVEVGPDKLCPFTPLPNSLNESIAAINTQLLKFKEECPNLDAAKLAPIPSDDGAKRIILMGRDSSNNPATTYTEGPKLPSPSTNGLIMDCMNYASLMQIEMEVAFENPISIQRYAECAPMPGMTNEELNSPSCIIKIYGRDKKMIENTCQQTGNLAVKQGTLLSLQAASRTIADAIASPNSCRQSMTEATNRALLSAGGNLLSSISSAGIAFGMPGLALSLGATMADGILRNFAFKTAADDYLDKIKQENEFPGMACLWLKIQDGILRCNSINQNLDPAYQTPLCQEYLRGGKNQDFSSIQSLLNYFTQAQSESQVPQVPQMGGYRNYENQNDTLKIEDKLATSFQENLDKLIPDPLSGKGKPITVLEHFNQMLKDMDKTKKTTEMKTQINHLKLILDLAKKIEESDDEELTRPYKTKFRSLFSKLDLGKIVDGYWKIKSENNGPKLDFSITEILGIQQQLSYSKMTQAPASSMSLITPANALIKIFKQRFINKLELVGKRYEESLKTLSHKANLKDSIDHLTPTVDERLKSGRELVKICSLLAGMYNSGELVDEQDPLSRVLGDNNPEYSRWCKNVECIGKPSIVLDQKSKTPGSFHDYQCKNKNNYNQNLQQLDQELKKPIDRNNPAICPGALKEANYFSQLFSPL